MQYNDKGNFKVYNTEKMQKNGHKKNVRVKRKVKKNKMMTFGIISIFVIYLSFAFVTFILTEEMPYTTAETGVIKEVTTVEGFITRSEKLVKGNQTGYIEYLYIEGEKIPSGSTVGRVRAEKGRTLIDTKINGVENEIMSSAESLNTESYNDELKVINQEIMNLLRQHVLKKDKESFSTLYSTKDRLDSMLTERYETYIVENNKALHQLLNSKEGYEKQQATNQSVIISGESGIISYSYDGYEDMSYDKVSKSTIDTYERNITQISLEPHAIDPKTYLYKLVDSYDWFITLLVDDSWEFQVDKTVQIKLEGDTEIMGQVVDVRPESNNYLVTVALNDHIHDFMNKRLVDVVIEEKTVEGLKLPNSALAEHELVGIPNTYVVKSNGRTGVVRKGIETDSFVGIETVYADDDYVYIEKPRKVESEDEVKGIGVGDILIAEASLSLPDHKISQLISIPGVYVVNKGYKEFRVIESLYTNQDYTIVANNTTFGIRLYDRVLLNKEE